jgi:hypothetical protein
MYRWERCWRAIDNALPESNRATSRGRGFFMRPNHAMMRLRARHLVGVPPFPYRELSPAQCGAFFSGHGLPMVAPQNGGCLPLARSLTPVP